jgi:hypothetical protein
MVGADGLGSKEGVRVFSGRAVAIAEQHHRGLENAGLRLAGFRPPRLKGAFGYADPTGFSARLSVSFNPFPKVGFGYATVGVPT